MTPKTLDKYIAALKKKAAAEGWSQVEYELELDKIQDDMTGQFTDGKITQAEYEKVVKQISNAFKSMSLQVKKNAPITNDEYMSIWTMIDYKNLTGKITDEQAQHASDLLDKLKAEGKSLKEINDKINAVIEPKKVVGNAAQTPGGNKQAAQTAGKAALSAGQLYQLENELVQKLNAKEISPADYLDKMDKLQELYANKASYDDAKAAAGLAPGKAAAAAPQGMSHEEYIGLWEALNKKKKAGLISKDEYAALGNKLDKAYHDKKTASEIEKEIGCDPGTLATDDAVIKLGKEFKKVYGQAAKDMKAKLDEFLKKAGPEIAELQLKMADGTITEDEMKRLEMKLLQQKILGQKVDQLTGVMTNANQKAMAMVNGEMLNVFAENANWQSYQLTQDTQMNLMFSIYDEHTVERLIKNKPELIPRKEVNGKKDQAWNRKLIAGAVTQAVIQGESIPQLARRIAADVGEKNSNAMMRYARTAMTCAQNNGRREMLHRAAGMGIKVKKKWLATLDSLTRDSHQKMDGVTVGVDEDFVTPLGSHMKCPGDMSGSDVNGGDIWNCRCTLIYEYEGFPNDATLDQRRDNETGEVIANMDYDEWKAAKKNSVLNDLSAAKYELAEAQKEFIAKSVNPDKEYKDLWKDPVTLKDYPDKKGGIPAKRDYYTAEIQKYKDAQANGASWATDDKIKELEKKRKLLNEFEKKGQILEKRDAALKKVQDLYAKSGIGKAAAAPSVAKKPKKQAAKAAPAAGGTSTPPGMSTGPIGAKATPFGPEAYTQERKDKALWTTDKRKVDGIMRQKTGEMWRNATPEEREAIHEYTYTYKKFNEPLRGIEYGTSRFLGVGKTDLNAGYKRSGRKLNAITDLLDRCSYDHDMWLQRGVRFDGMDKFFNVQRSLLETGTEAQLKQALLGTTPTEYAFGSMGSAKGEGFSGDIILNIYAPAGTKMLYAEPWSYYGHDRNGRLHEMDGAKWDGRSTQPNYGTEFETILQQGTQFRVTKVERRGRGTIFIDLEIINQDNQQRWKP